MITIEDVDGLRFKVISYSVAQFSTVQLLEENKKKKQVT